MLIDDIDFCGNSGVTSHRVRPTGSGIEIPVVFRDRLIVGMCEGWVHCLDGARRPLGVPK
jgi:hypothetical protein